MIHPFVFNSVTTLVIGWALLLQWHRYPGARFTRDIGIVYLALSATPVLIYIHTQAGAMGKALALAGLLVCGPAYLTFLVMGIFRLADRELSGPRLAALAFALLLIGGYPLVRNDWPLALAVSGTVTFGVGVVAWYWLRQSPRSDRWIGPLLCLMGTAQFSQMVWGAESLAWQLTVNTLVRLLLGLALLHTALQLAIEQARRLSENYERLTLNSHQGVIVAFTQKIVYCNPAFLRIYGLTSLEEASPAWISAPIAPDELAANLKLRQQVLDGSLQHARWEGVRRRKDGKPLYLRFSAWRTEWNGVPALQTVISDDTEHHNTMAALLHQATHDDLTGLPNRSALLQRLRECSQGQQGFGLVVLDIDRFKLFSGAFGHSLGDEVLRTMTGLLQSGLADMAEVSRLGTDSFALLTPAGTDASQVHGVVQRVRELLASPLVLPDQKFFVDVSMGIALFPQTAKDAESLLRAANAAMYEAKKIAGTSSVVAETRYELGTGAVLQQEQALRAGVKQREFSLAYQPKVDAGSGVLLGFEALARWYRDGFEPVPPVQFIAVAERTGLIGALGMLLLEQACEQLVGWRNTGAPLVPIAVNVSPLQMLNPAFPKLVHDTLQRYGIRADLITLEITESAAIDNMEQARAQLVQLQDQGLQVAMDDFGTGFSSLAMLRTLPLYAVKIDRSLIDPMPAPDAVAVVQAICQLAAVLNLRVVAEGVETREQAQAAHCAGCHEVQGYYFSQPLAPEIALQWLNARGRPAVAS